MKGQKLSVTMVLSLFIIHPIWAENDPNQAINHYWQCMAHDNQQKKLWPGRSAYQQVAINKALEACKKESRAPLTCMPLKNDCDYYENDVLQTHEAS